MRKYRSWPGGKICALAAAILCAAAGQTAFPLENLTIQGNQRIPAAKIIAASGLKIGARVAKSDFDDARARLMATGAFESVGYIFKPSADNAGFDATIEVAEVQQLYPYRFEDLPVPDEQLRAALRQLSPLLGDEIPVTNQALDKYIDAIQRMTGSKMKIAGKLEPDAAGNMAIVFQPDVPRERVAEVKFSGNQILPSAALVQAFAAAAVGTEYRETTMRVLLDSSVRPLYEARGRLRVSFPKIETKPSLFTQGVQVIVTVDEGPCYSLGDVEIAGIPPSDGLEMAQAANLQPKDVADMDEVKAALDRVLAKYRSRGFLRASGKMDRRVDDQARKVSVTLHIDPGARYAMGELEIIGLDSSSEPEIRKMWKLKTGDPFNAEYPDVFLAEIRKQQVFDNLGQTRSETTIDDKNRTAGVKLYFSAAPSDPRRNKIPR
jgi:outer membrane protein insertion porin family